jgi:PH domain
MSGAGRLMRKSMAVLTPTGPQAQSRVRKRTPPPIDEHKPPLPEGRPPALTAGSAVRDSVGGEADIAARPDLALPTNVAPASAGADVSGDSAPPPFRGYMNKRGEITLFKSPWKKRFFCLEAGSDGEEGSFLTYYTSESSWQRGEKPLKGHRIPMREMQISLPGQQQQQEAASGSSGAAAVGGNADIVLAPISSSSSSGDSGRVWQFVCESKSDLHSWVRAMIQHGAKPPALHPSTSFSLASPPPVAATPASRMSLRASMPPPLMAYTTSE